MIDFISNHKEDLMAIGGAIVAIASALANLFPKAGKLSKLVHFLALNFKVDKVK